MYSVLLMVAMTGAADAPAYYPQPVSVACYGCTGCYGSTSCYGCSGCYGTVTYRTCYGCTGCTGCYGCTGCTGCYGGCTGVVYSSCYGCCGGCTGCYGCSGCHGCTGCYGCCGGCTGVVYSSCYGCCGGCTGCYGCSGCCGGTIAPSKPEPKPEGKPDKKQEARNSDAPATLVVNLPADAKLIVDGVKTEGSTERRVFVSPTLIKGKEYFYKLNVEVVRDGKSMTVSKEATVRAGEETSVTIEDPSVVAKR